MQNVRIMLRSGCTGHNKTIYDAIHAKDDHQALQFIHAHKQIPFFSQYFLVLKGDGSL